MLLHLLAFSITQSVAKALSYNQYRSHRKPLHFISPLARVVHPNSLFYIHPPQALRVSKENIELSDAAFD
jgi:hypothetical protein